MARSTTTTPAATPPLLAYLDGLVGELQRLVPLALRDWDEEAIHQSRVATRRLKAGVDLFRPVLSDEVRRPFAKVTRQLRRRLGPLRDLDVMIGHLGRLAKHKRHATAVAWVTAQLQAQRDRARGESLEDAPPAKVLAKLASWHDVRREIGESAEAIDSLLVESIHLQLDAFAEQADRLLCAPGQDGASSPAPAVPQDVHQLRIAGKALRYTLEMAREHGRPLDRRVMRTFKRMQEALGLWHDLVVLTEWAMRTSLEGLLAHHDTNLQADVLALARANEGAQLAQTIRASFPITQRSEDAAAASAPTPCVTVETSAPETP